MKFTAKCDGLVSAELLLNLKIWGVSQQAVITNLCSIFLVGLVGLVTRFLEEGADMVNDLCLAKTQYYSKSNPLVRTNTTVCRDRG